ncbi:MAG: sphingomyelin phosphodiesterase [Bacteroidia bacterium]|nr:sphingomyelin phosphodiesterase [Bacteroidia bacterium]MDW8333345.1 sphingomyelin phosphodiesterase [Bacteroidia bacterium]
MTSILICLLAATCVAAKRPIVIPGDTLRILSWNIYMLPKPLITGQYLRTPKIIQALKRSRYDVLCLQEAFIKKIERRLKTELETEYPYFANLPVYSKPLKFVNSGLAILSRHPIRFAYGIVYDEAKGIDKTSQKGALLVEIEVDGKPVQVVCTHLQSGSGARSQRIRDRQYLQLYERLLQPFERPGVPQILAGDMNTEQRDSVRYRRMLRTLKMKDSNPKSRDCSYHGEVCDLVGKSERHYKEYIDYVLYRTNQALIRPLWGRVKRFMAEWNGPTLGRKRDLSDHFAVEAVFVLGENDDKSFDD